MSDLSKKELLTIRHHFLATLSVFSCLREWIWLLSPSRESVYLSRFESIQSDFILGNRFCPGNRWSVISDDFRRFPMIIICFCPKPGPRIAIYLFLYFLFLFISCYSSSIPLLFVFPSIPSIPFYSLPFLFFSCNRYRNNANTTNRSRSVAGRHTAS